MEHLSLREHVKLRYAFVCYKINTEHRLVARAKGVDDECGTGVERVRLERHVVVVVRLDVGHTLADHVKPVGGLVVGVVLPGAVEVLVQLLELRLYTLAAGDVTARLGQKVSVLKCRELVCVVLLNNVQNVVADILRA